MALLGFHSKDTQSGSSAVVGAVCHRGANHLAPENTLAAAEQALAWGAVYIEVDVRTSRDGILYNLHDSTVDRTTNGTGRLRDLTSAEIDVLDAGSWFDSRFADERLPRLEPFLRWVQGKAGVFFDVKDADLPQLIALVRQIGMEKECFFWFDRDDKAREFRTLAPDLILKMNAETLAEVRRAHEEFGASIIEISPRGLTPEIIRECRERGILVMVLYKGNDPTVFQKIIEQGVDLCNLDYPDIFAQVQREKAS